MKLLNYVKFWGTINRILHYTSGTLWNGQARPSEKRACLNSWGYIMKLFMPESTQLWAQLSKVGDYKRQTRVSPDTFPTFRGKLSSPTESRFLKVSNITSTYKALWAGSRHFHSSGENWMVTSFNVNCDLKKKIFTKAMRRVLICIQNE